MLISVIFTVGCSGTTTFHGIVKESVNDKAVDNAYVLVRFIGDGDYVLPDPGATARNRCYGSLVLRSDVQGRFDLDETLSEIPTTDKYTHNQKIYITVYKPGYTMGKVYDFKNNTDKNYPVVFAKYMIVEGSEISVKLATTSKYEMFNRDYYLNDVINGFCSDFALGHWRMMKTMLDDIYKWGSTTNHWITAGKICRLMNKKNEQNGLGQNNVDCSIYDNKLKQVRAKFYDGLKNIIHNIDWGEGLKLEFLPDLNVVTTANYNIFYILNSKHDLDEKNVLAALKKICASSYPRNIAEGLICIFDGPPPKNWRKLGGESCNVYYQRFEYKLKIRKPNAPENRHALGSHWCR